MGLRVTAVIPLIAALGCVEGYPESVDLTVDFFAPIDFREACEVSTFICEDPHRSFCVPRPTHHGECPEAQVTAEGDLVQVLLEGIVAETASASVFVSTEEVLCIGVGWYEMKRAKQREFIDDFECVLPID